VPTVSLHVHERIDPHTIVDAVRKRNGNGLPVQPSLFERREENPPLREAIDFYRHAHGWSNRMIAGDSLIVMNSLLEKEGTCTASMRQERAGWPCTKTPRVPQFPSPQEIDVLSPKPSRSRLASVCVTGQCGCRSCRSVGFLSCVFA
jgi:hypothetical protein